MHSLKSAGNPYELLPRDCPLCGLWWASVTMNVCLADIDGSPGTRWSCESHSATAGLECFKILGYHAQRLDWIVIGG